MFADIRPVPRREDNLKLPSSSCDIILAQQSKVIFSLAMFGLVRDLGFIVSSLMAAVEGTVVLSYVSSRLKLSRLVFLASYLLLT